MDLKKIAIVIGVVISLSTVTGIMFKLDSRWAKAGTVRMLSMRLDIKILEDHRKAVQARIWQLDDRFPPHKTKPLSVREEYRKLKQKIEDLDKQIEKLLGQQGG